MGSLWGWTHSAQMFELRLVVRSGKDNLYSISGVVFLILLGWRLRSDK